MKYLLLIGVLILCAAPAFSESPCDALKRSHGQLAPAAGEKRSFAKKLMDRTVCAVELAQIDHTRRQIQQSLTPGGGLNTNQNGGRAKYAMDGVSVGKGYYID